MRRLLSIVAVLLAVAGVVARGSMQAPEEPEGEKKLIDLKSDLMGPVAPGDSVVFLVGNFAAQHNGAVITCDSAVRYSDMRIEFFGNVLINKNTTYIYGDRAEYDGNVNEARVYSDIVKVVDGDATLYTYKFLFNTKTNVGEFADGGVLTNRENLLEAVRGYYYADTKELVAVDRVEMRNDEYELKGDSVVYNMATDNAYFFEHTNIWNRDGDYLYADRGSYEKADSLYIITRNGYILTEKQEIWSDRLLPGGGSRHHAPQPATGRCRTQGGRVRGLRRVLEESRKCLSDAPPGGHQLRSFAGRLALHAGRLDVPLHDQLRGGTAGSREGPPGFAGCGRRDRSGA